MILGITGGTGCGKTTLLNEIRRMDGSVFDCDAIYHHLLCTDERMLGAIQARFPAAFSSGILDRKALGRIVFSDPDALAVLNGITHPCVRREVTRRLSDTSGLAAIDAISLFEAGLDRLCDVTVAVTAPQALRIARLCKRDGISPDYARARIAAQHDDAWFADRCDYVLVNDGGIDAFATKCVAFLQETCIIDT